MGFIKFLVIVLAFEVVIFLAGYGCIAYLWLTKTY